MPFAPYIRKEILKALEEHIIPALEREPIVQVLAEPPFDLLPIEYGIEQKCLLPDQQAAPLQILRRWKKERLVAVREPTLRFVYMGVSYERIGITTGLARQMEATGQSAPGGITMLQLPAPGIICFGRHIPQNDGTHFAKQKPDLTRALNIKLMGNEVLVALTEKFQQTTHSTHSIEVSDPILAQMGLIYMDELRQSNGHSSAQTQLRVLMYRLKRYLLLNHAPIGNTCWIDWEANPNPTPNNKQELCNEVMDYVQRHQHLPLSLKMIAGHFGLSMLHLNRIFRQVHGTTVMRYVTVQRINTAKQILVSTRERVNDVAKLVGFSSTASFCTVFRRHTGLSPNEFRQQEQNNRKYVF